MSNCEETIEEISQVFSISKLQNNEYQILMKIDSGMFNLRICFSKEHPKFPPILICSRPTEHALIDRFGVIRYPEYFDWTPTTAFSEILLRLQLELNKTPPTKLQQQKFPEIENHVKAFAGRINCQDDLIEVLRNYKEYKESENIRIKMMNDNKALANLLQIQKKEYEERFKANQNFISAYQNWVRYFESLQKKVEDKNKNFRENDLMQCLRRIELKSVSEAKEKLNKFMMNEIGVNEFVKLYKNEVKTQKIVMMIKNIKDN